jgi:hypothetical protein
MDRKMNKEQTNFHIEKNRLSLEILELCKKIIDKILEKRIEDFDKVTIKNLMDLFFLKDLIDNRKLSYKTLPSGDLYEIKNILFYDKTQFGESQKLSNNLRASKAFDFRFHWKDYIENLQQLESKVEEYQKLI